MNRTDIAWLHVEASSRCNAWCPACPRNLNGYTVSPRLVEQDLSTERFKEIIEQFPNLYAVQFCGNHGDPIIAKNILELIDVAKKHVKKIQIHTNGSLRTEQWWHELADILKDVEHDVWFGIDGLKDVHEIYRQATDFDKIISNATAFINNGGYATWQLIPFAHNEHQITKCIKLSQDLKFKKFKLIKVYRNKTLARNYRTGEEYSLEPTKEFRQMIQIKDLNKTVKKENCMHLSQPGIYVNSSGEVSYCCYQTTLETPFVKKFDTVDNLLYNPVDISSKVCIFNCGTL